MKKIIIPVAAFLFLSTAAGAQTTKNNAAKTAASTSSVTTGMKAVGNTDKGKSKKTVTATTKTKPAVVSSTKPKTAIKRKHRKHPKKKKS